MERNLGRLECGGCLLASGVVQLAVVMLLAQLYYPCGQHGCYNIFTNPISDFGNTATSALWPLFNYSLALFGIMTIAGAFLAARAFSRIPACRLGLVLIVASALGAVGVGVVPENTILTIHSASALVAFVGGGIAALLFGVGMRGRKEYRSYSLYSMLTGALTLLSILVFMLPSFGMLPAWRMYGPGFGFGGMERIAAYLVLAWLYVTGMMLVRRRTL